MQYDETMRGAQIAYRPTDGAEQVATDFRNSGTVDNIPNGARFIMTGYYWVVDGYSWIQTTNGYYVSAHFSSGQIDNWVINTDVTKRIPVYSQTQAQALVQKIIKNNKEITRCNILCARYADRFTKAQLAQIKALQSRVIERNKALQNEGLTENVKTGYPEEYAELSSYLDKIMTDGSIGIATWVVVVIAATVIAATATAAYFAYKNLAEESERDVKYSKELTRTLTSKLTDEEYQQLLNETKGMLTKTKIKSLVRGGWDTFKYLLIGGVCAYIAYDVTKYYKQQ